MAPKPGSLFGVNTANTTDDLSLPKRISIVTSELQLAGFGLRTRVTALVAGSTLDLS